MSIDSEYLILLSAMAARCIGDTAFYIPLGSGFEAIGGAVVYEFKRYPDKFAGIAASA